MPVDNYAMMKDIENDMFGDCPKDDDDKYIMPAYYNEWVHIENQLNKMGKDGIIKLVQDYGILKAINRYFIYTEEYPQFTEDDEDDNFMRIQRILASSIIERWMVAEEIVSDMTIIEYEAEKKDTKRKEDERDNHKDLIIDRLISNMTIEEKECEEALKLTFKKMLKKIMDDL